MGWASHISLERPIYIFRPRLTFPGISINDLFLPVRPQYEILVPLPFASAGHLPYSTIRSHHR